MSPQKASNWVDRGEVLEQTLVRVLAHPLGLEADDARLQEHALTIRGLVEADASELHVTRYVRALFPQLGRPDPDATMSRTLGIALWHIAKAGLVRDRAARRANELARQIPPAPRLSESLAKAILGAPTE